MENSDDCLFTTTELYELLKDFHLIEKQYCQNYKKGMVIELSSTANVGG